jgi:hypothetical protein
MSFTIQSPDLKKLEQTFADLQYKEQRNIMLSAFRKATKPTVERAKSNIFHSVTGNLRRSIGLVTVRDEIAVIIGARKRGAFMGHHGHLVEEGTVDRWATTWRGKPLKTKRFTGKMSAGKPYAFYLKHSVDATEKSVQDTMAKEWYDSILRFHNKHGIK